MPRKRKKPVWIIILLVLLAVGGGGYAYYTAVYLPTQTPVETETLQTAKVRRGDLVVSAGAAGSLVPVQEAALSFRSGGTLAELTVRPGDAVTAGQILARLDEADAQAQLAQAETNLRLAQNKLAEADTTSAQAEANLHLAELKLESLLTGPEPSAVAIAQANLDSAQADMDALLAGPTDDDIAVAVVEIEQAAIAVKQAQAAYDTIAWADDAGATPQAAALQSATLAYEKTLAAYRQKIAEASPEQIAAAQAKLTQAQQQLNDLQAGPDEADIAAAQIAVEQAQANLLAAQNMTALEIGVEQAQLNIDTARRNLEALALRAPFAGIVTDVTAVAGEMVGTNPLITMFDSSRAWLELYLDETDLDKLTVGNEVEVIFDALPDLTFSGQIIRINPSLIVVDGVPVVSALAELDDPESTENIEPVAYSDGDPAPAPGVKLMPGMNAAVEVIAGRAEDTLLVPVEALRELGPGQYAVFVMTDGQPRLRPVKVGLQDLTYAEILDGLEQGEEVTTGIIATE